MLTAAPKGDVLRAVPVEVEEDRVLRSAFGRYGGRPKARAAAALVVARYQQLGAGHWFLCGCRPGEDRPPALVPVAQTHIRRHEDARWPAHSETCDFYRDPDDQRVTTASYCSHGVVGPWQLTRPFAQASEVIEQKTTSSSYHKTRPAIARLLVKLVTDAGLQRMLPDWRPSEVVDQVRAIWTAAKSIEIDEGVMLPDFLRTSPARLHELVAAIEAAPPGRFRRTRPHGVLIVRLASVRAGVLQPISGEAIPVRGRVAVFGESAEARPGDMAERAARAPYLAACVVGRARVDGPVEVLSAYAHPCAGEKHLMLVDSDMERRSLAQLRSVQKWLGREKRVGVTIEKPMFDIGPVDNPGIDPRPPCIPDFIVRAFGRDGVDRTVIGETMGFAHEGYREGKKRSHRAMIEALAGAPLAAHDFHYPEAQRQKDRDDSFWREVRWALTGTEAV